MKSSTSSHRSREAAPTTRSAAGPDLPSGPELLRRGVLALVTALIVARPQVLGEDPGLLNPTSDLFGLLLTFLWFVAAVTWSIWRAWSGQGSWYGGLVEAGLFGVVLMMFVGAAAPASYKHPAWLIAWEWLALLVAFFLVRQLTTTATEQQCLLAAVLATGVGLAVHGIHQSHVEMPRLRAELLAVPERPPERRPESVAALLAAPAAPGMPLPAALPWGDLVKISEKGPPTPLQTMLARQGVYLEADDPQMEVWTKRVAMDHAFSRFAHPNSFAGYLALLLPAAAGCAFVSWRSQRPTWMTVLAAGCVLIMAYALWLTHSRGAILGLLLAGAAAAALYWRRPLLAHRKWVAAAAVGLVLLATGAYLMFRSDWGNAAMSKEPGTAEARLDYWSATWKMIGEHALLGVGPGNFSRFYPRYMSPTAAEHITDPHNFLLEVWTAAGILAPLALLVALGAFFWRVGSSAWRAEGVNPLFSKNRGVKPPRSPDGWQRVYWEFYLGGMVGLLLAFMAWTPGKVKDEIVQEGTAAGVVAVAWFASFALFEKISWTGPGRALTLAAGVLALVLNLSVSGGISFPSVALMMWVMTALALNALPQTPKVWLGQHWLGRVVPVPLLLALCVVYSSKILNPVTEGMKYARFANDQAMGLLGQPGGEGRKPRRDVSVARNILPALEKAIEEDPGNAAHRLQAAHWYGEAWQFHPGTLDLYLLAIGRAAEVHGLPWQRDKNPGLDPEDKDAYLAGYRIRKMYADRLSLMADDPKDPLARPRERYRHYDNAAELLHHAVIRDPTEARLHYQLAEVLFLLEKASDDLRQQAGKAARQRRQEALRTPAGLAFEGARSDAAEAARGLELIEAQAAQRKEAAGREARRQAQTAFDLDAAAPVPTRKLTNPQRAQVRQWLKAPSPS